MFYAGIVLNLVKGSLKKLTLSSVNVNCKFDILRSLKRLTDVEVELPIQNIKQSQIVPNILKNLNVQTVLTIKLKEEKNKFFWFFEIMEAVNCIFSSYKML